MLKPLKFLTAAALTVALVAGFAAKQADPAYAQGTGGRLTIDPATTSVASGGNVTLTIKVDTGGRPVNAVQANLSYPTNRFDSVSVDTSGSAFSVDAQKTAGNGSISIARGNVSAVTGNVELAKVTFHTSSVGSAAISWAAGSHIVDSTDNQEILGGSTGATVNITSTSTSTGGGSTSTKSTTTSTASKGTPTAAASSPSGAGTVAVAPAGSADTSAPTISEFRIDKVTDSSAVVHWVTNEPTTGVVEYGIDGAYNFSATSPSGTTHDVTLQKPLIDKGTKYNVQVTATDAAGNATRSASINFQTPGYQLTIKVVDDAGLPIAGAKVTIGGQTVVTDINGLAKFDNVSATGNEVSIESGGQTIKSTLDKEAKNSTKPVVVKASRGFSVVWAAAIFAGLVGTIILLALLMSPGVRRKIAGLYGGDHNFAPATAKVEPPTSAQDIANNPIATVEPVSGPPKPGDIVHPEGSDDSTPPASSTS